MLDFIVPFLVYALAFAVGSVGAFLVASRLHPASSEREALAELDARTEPNGDPR